MDVNFLKKIVAYVNGTQGHLNKQANTQSRVAQMAPDVVEVLLSKGLIEPFQKQAAIDGLNDHVKALEILKAAASYASNSVPAMGVPTPDTFTSNVRESDRVFLDNLFGND